MIRAVGTALRLARGSVLGVTWAFAALGVATGANGPTLGLLAWALLAATAFHVAVYAWNDIVDLPLDRTEPRRAASPLVLGTVSVRFAMLAACASAGVALAVATAGGLDAVLAMGIALLALASYDVWGKRVRLSPATDAVQGIGWAALVWFGSAMAGGMTTQTWWAASFVVVLIMLVNGVTGAARDLPNDARHGARTTAQLLGARTDPDGTVRLTSALRFYAATLQVGAVAMAIAVLGTSGAPTGARLATVLAVALAGTAALVVTLAPRTRTTTAWTAGLAHILAMVLLPFAALAQVGGPVLALVTIVSIAPWLGSGWLRHRLRGAIHGAQEATA